MPSIGPAAIAAPAAVPPATNAKAAAPVITILLAFILTSLNRRIWRAARARSYRQEPRLKREFDPA